MLPKIIAGYYEVSQNARQQELERKNRLNNLPKYSIKDILEGDSSSDEDMDVDPMVHFPWLKRDYQNVYDDLIIAPGNKQTAANYPTDEVVKLYEKSKDALNLDTIPTKFLIITAS